MANQTLGAPPPEDDPLPPELLELLDEEDELDDELLDEELDELELLEEELDELEEELDELEPPESCTVALLLVTEPAEFETTTL